MTLRTLNYGNYGIFLIMGNAGFCPSTVLQGSCAHIAAFIPSGEAAGNPVGCNLESPL